MQLELSTPSILFPAISLLLLAYTNRFLAVANVIRTLHRDYLDHPSPNIMRQIINLRSRIKLIRDMQTIGIVAVFICVLCMALIYTGYNELASYLFGFSLILMLISLGLSIYEIHISTKALNLEIQDILDDEKSFYSGLRRKLRKQSRTSEAEGGIIKTPGTNVI